MESWQTSLNSRAGLHDRGVAQGGFNSNPRAWRSSLCLGRVCGPDRETLLAIMQGAHDWAEPSPLAIGTLRELIAGMGDDVEDALARFSSDEG